MPEKLPGKVILTNTTTQADHEIFKRSGAAYLVTTTPRYEGRSFGTNVMEAALIAVSGKNRELTSSELMEMIESLSLKPDIQRLN
jgi:hypothetical protein